ncbi:uncharacterized protein A4U43_C04F10210 [Asparagus officinalis]|uniref:Uncharacterized protein n=1 Tax=Asparagus officinalis TaxID=4686 RepID=A0A5P1EZR7_ASPOF|nr:uncharacterized protein A4U43_C04F10210 [Asparagus officinalis]
MSFHRLKAAITGLLEARRVNEWIVTKKLGDAHRTKPAAKHVVDIERLEDAQLLPHRTKPAAKHVVDIERENTSSKEKSNSFGFFGGRFGPDLNSDLQGHYGHLL